MFRWIRRTSSKDGPPAAVLPERRRIDLGDERPPYPIYAIGDVHGSIDELLSAEERVFEDIRRSGRPGPLIYLGDYIDRGANSAAVIDHLSRPSTLGLRRATLCGNHEAMACGFLFSPQVSLEWLSVGGEQTLRSYGITVTPPRRKQAAWIASLREEARSRIPKEHVEFLLDLPLSIRIGPYVFVHAGIRPGVPLDDQGEGDLLWIREPFLTEGPQLPVTVIHGHTPVAKVDFGPGRIGIDTGAWVTGNLSILKVCDGILSVL